MFDKMQKSLLIGLGALVLTKEKTEDVIKDLIKKGEISRDQGMNFLEELGSKAGEEKDRINKILNKRIENIMEKLGTPTRNDIEKMERKLQILEERIEELEEKTQE